MNIKIERKLFSDEDRTRLCTLFNINNNDDDFTKEIEKISHAAIVEYKEMLLGNGLPTRADEIRQRRLLHLIKYYFLDRIPTETEISSMFQLTEAESRTLLKSVKTRFRYELMQKIKDTLKHTVNSAQKVQNSNKYRVIIKSNNILEELNRLIGQLEPLCPPITKQKDTSQNFEMSGDAYDKLVEYLNG